MDKEKVNNNHQGLNNKLLVVLFRWITILIITFLVFYKRGQFSYRDPAVILLIIITLSNGLLSFTKESFFHQPKFIFFVLLADIIFISILFRFISSENQLYLIFFAVLFISSIAQNVRWSLLIAMVASIFYLSLLTFKQNANITSLFLNPEITIKIPFIFLIAIWTSFWSEQYRKKKEEEEKIKEFNRELEKGIKIAIAKEKEVTRELKKMKEYNENILKSLNSGVIVVNNKGTVTTINPKAREVLNLKTEKITGRSLFKVKKFNGFSKMVSDVLKSGKKNGVHEVTLKNGKTLSMTFSPLVASGKTTGATVVFQDITEIKKIKEQMKQSESLANLGKTVAWIAHEIRNILTNIMGYTQLIEMKYGNKNNGMKNYLEGLLHSTKKISVLMTDILDFSKTRKIKTEKVNISKFLNELMEDFTQSSNGTKLIIENNARVTNINSNYEALHCVISNLVRNAKEAIEENGSRGKITVRFKKDNGNYVFEVEDTGQGIEKDKLKSIFNPFFTTKKNGTGLGLSIVKKITESLDGKISVSSVPAKGTKFTVAFPEKK